MNLKKSSLVFENHTKKTMPVQQDQALFLNKIMAMQILKSGTLFSYSFRALWDYEKRYTHIEKETLFFGVECFHEYLYGCIFIRINDNKPLKSIFNRSIIFSLFASSKFFYASKSMTSNSNIHLAKTCQLQTLFADPT